MNRRQQKPYPLSVTILCTMIFLTITGTLLATLIRSAQSPPAHTTSSISEARKLSRECTEQGGTANIKTIWEGVKPKAYEIRCYPRKN